MVIGAIGVLMVACRSLGKLGRGRVRLLLLRAPGGALGRRVRSARRAGVLASLQVPEPLALDAPWPDAERAFAPSGHVPSPTVPGAIVPICPSGLSIAMAPFVLARRTTRGVLRAAVVRGGARRGDVGRRLALRRARGLSLESARRGQPDRALSGDSADERCAGRSALDAGRRTRDRHQASLERLERSRDERGDSRPSQSRAAGDHHRPVPAAAARADLAAAASICCVLRARVRARLRDGRADAERLLRIAARVGLWLPVGAVFTEPRDSRISAAISDGSGPRTRRRLRSRLLAPWLLPGGLTALALVMFLVNLTLYVPYVVFDDWSYLRFLLPTIPLLLILVVAGTRRRAASPPSAGCRLDHRSRGARGCRSCSYARRVNGRRSILRAARSAIRACRRLRRPSAPAECARDHQL